MHMFQTTNQMGLFFSIEQDGQSMENIRRHCGFSMEQSREYIVLLWKTNGKHIGNIWNQYGTHMEILWKNTMEQIFGKHIIWKKTWKDMQHCSTLDLAIFARISVRNIGDLLGFLMDSL